MKVAIYGGVSEIYKPSITNRMIEKSRYKTIIGDMKCEHELHAICVVNYGLFNNE